LYHVYFYLLCSDKVGANTENKTLSQYCTKQGNTSHLNANRRCRRGRDRMVVGFITTCAISAYHHYSCEFEPCS